MRELKFRVFDKILNKYIPYNSFLSFDSKEYIFEQFTGLTDKNGKEIYEGDILTTKLVTKTEEGKTFSKCGIGKIVFDVINDIDDFYSPYVLGWGIDYKAIQNNKIIYTNITSLYNTLKEYNSPIMRDYFSSKEIEKTIDLIGNINENPELLNNE